MKITTEQVVETSVTFNNSPFQDYVHLDDHAQPTYEMTAGFKPFTRVVLLAFKIKMCKYLAARFKRTSITVQDLINRFGEVGNWCLCSLV